MPKDNIFHPRRPLIAKLNDNKAEIPIIVATTTEELSKPKNHFGLTDQEKMISRLQLFVKKGKMFGYEDKQPVMKISALASKTITIFGKPQQMAPASIMQNEEFFSILKDKANTYLDNVLKVPTRESEAETYLQRMVEQLYQIIKKSNPHKDEIIHLATIERDLSTPDVGKNRLTAEFSTLLLAELNQKISQNHESWKVEIDRVLMCIQRTSRAESHGIHRIAQQPLLLYQTKSFKEEIAPKEKVIIIDDHIQTGTAISSAATEIIDNNADLLSIVCISAHKNCLFFNIQPDVKEFITRLLPQGVKDLPRLNAILKHVRLDIETLTNVEGMILSAMLSDSKNQEQKSIFENLLKKYDASDDINYSLFKNQKNSLWEEFEKPKVEFANFESELLAAIEKGRYTIPYTKQVVLSDEDGRNIRKEVDARSNLPWLIFELDGTLHNITDTYQLHKDAKSFEPKMNKEDFLSLRNKYRIGIVADSKTFATKLLNIKSFYGVDIDGYIYIDQSLSSKPNPELLHEFCKTYNVKDKPVAYVGANKKLYSGIAKNVNIKFINVDPQQATIDMEQLTKELNTIEEQRKVARQKWGLLKNVVIHKTAIKKSVTKNLR